MFSLHYKTFRIFHFVSHELTHSLNLSKNSLILSDELLTVESLFKLNLHNCVSFSAYFLMCETEDIKHDNLINKVLYLISAYQLADFQHVIDMLWKINNQLCIEVMIMTYKWMKWKNMSNNFVAECFHQMSYHLHNQWNLKSAAHTLKYITAVCAESDSAVIK